MNTSEIFAIISTIFALLAVIPYIITILQKKTRPHQYSWFVFTLMSGISFFSQYFEGGRNSVLVALVFFIASFVIFTLSLTLGIRNSSKWDKTLLSLAGITILVWFFTNNVIAIWLSILIDALATFMTILKIKQKPYSEEPIPWVIGGIAFIFSILTLLEEPLSILFARPIYGLMSQFAIVIAVYIARKTSSNKKRSPNYK